MDLFFYERTSKKHFLQEKLASYRSQLIDLSQIS